MPKLWNETIEGHRAAVQKAVLDATAALVHEHGLASVTMSEVAKTSGIGRATLYKYFPDIDTILATWHKRHVAGHLEVLKAIASRPAEADARLAEVLRAYAHLSSGHQGAAPMLHSTEHLRHAKDHLRDFLGQLIANAQNDGCVRTDTSPAELATFAMAALDAAGSLASKAATDRLAALILDGLTAKTT